MSTKLKVAVEKSTKMIVVSFFDENDIAKDPATIKWTLTDTLGNIINERKDVVIAEPSSVETVILSRDDLAIISGTDNGKRLLTVEATYDSELGIGLTLTGEANFTVINLIAIEDEV